MEHNLDTIPLRYCAHLTKNDINLAHCWTALEARWPSAVAVHECLCLARQIDNVEFWRASIGTNDRTQAQIGHTTKVCTSPHRRSIRVFIDPSTMATKLQPSGGKRSFDTMTADELIQIIQDQESRIAVLENENKKLKTKTTATALVPTAVVSPQKLHEKVKQIQKLACRGIKSQMKWKSVCKYGTARFSWSSLCDEAVFRSLLQLDGKAKTKGAKFLEGEFSDIIGSTITASIRYGSLYVRGPVNVSYTKSGEIKITGGYGM